MNNPIDDTLALIKASQANASADILAKNFTQPGSATTGLQAYDLEAPSKKIVPIMTPLRNRIPRRLGGFGTQANWKAITGINSGGARAGVSEGKRGGQIAHTMAEYLAAYRGIGLEKSVTFEADYAARGFEDVKALAVQHTLKATMIAEEVIILGGNTSNALGTTPTPTLSASGSGATLPALTYSVICVALGLQAYWDAAGLNNGATAQAFAAATSIIPGQITRTNADGSTDTFGGGSAQKSAAATQAVTLGQTLFASVAAVRGAVGYAWFTGAAGAEKLEKISTINSVTFTAPLVGTGQAATTLTGVDSSTSSLEFDGLLTIASKASLNSYYVSLATGTAGTGTTLTGAGGRIAEIDTALASFFSSYRMCPDEILMSFVQFQKIGALVLGATNPGIMFTVDVNSANKELVAGRNVGKYMSPINGKLIDLVVHPNMPPGTMLLNTWTVPEYVDGVGDLVRIRLRQEYYQIEWPLRTRKYEYGVYADEVLQHFFPPAMGIITNIA